MDTDNKVIALLLQDTPTLEEILGALSKSTTIDNARHLLYRLTKDVHSATFPPISQMELVLTEGCNLGCHYCFEKEMLGSRSMSLETARKAVDLLVDYSANEHDLHIALFGGEPTLNMGLLKSITEYAEQAALSHGKNIHLNMTTNGTLIDDAKAAYFKEHNINVLVSIDGMQESNDLCRIDKRGRSTFEKTISGIKVLKKYQPWIGVKMTVMPANVARIYNDVSGLYKLGVNQFTIGHATSIPWSEDAIKQYAHQMDTLKSWYTIQDHNTLSIMEFEEALPEKSYFGCQAGRSSISVSVSGEISPCSKILAINSRQPISKLGDVDSGLYLLKNRVELVSCTTLKTNCQSAGINDQYQGGCFAVNHDETGDIFKPSIQEHHMSQALG